MQNMYTMARDEAAETPQERAFARWLKDVRRVAGGDVDEDLAWDLFIDGCDPISAVHEMRNQ
ncbi:hypothetical protein BLA13014_04614 [Burkholderia aenigmatica]|uniref:Uncharacterized protein n=1 Tax=Burkholderia aenigmatica TaxID=2015348 RepID=A0A6P2NUN8_9BURK|nr:hypothetical protein [Burkholderia aenigmatica]VWB98632.1 hypothetical protein BLA13014_04614 [Burkholderia aenigmatica]